MRLCILIFWVSLIKHYVNDYPTQQSFGLFRNSSNYYMSVCQLVYLDVVYSDVMGKSDQMFCQWLLYALHNEDSGWWHNRNPVCLSIHTSWGFLDKSVQRIDKCLYTLCKQNLGDYFVHLFVHPCIT